jgi:hypothetical protein
VRDEILEPLNVEHAMGKPEEGNESEKVRQQSNGVPDADEAPGRPIGAPKRIPGQNIDKKNAERKSKDGDVDEDGRGRLTRDND